MAPDARKTVQSDLREGRAVYSSSRERILESMLAIVDADAEDNAAYHRAWVRWRKTMLECGWRPPGQHKPKPSMVTNQLPLWRQEARR